MVHVTAVVISSLPRFRHVFLLDPYMKPAVNQMSFEEPVIERTLYPSLIIYVISLISPVYE